MSDAEVAFVVAGAVSAVANLIVLRSLWVSPLYERSQKIMQTMLVWLVPGSAVFVWRLLRDPASAGGRGGLLLGDDAPGGMFDMGSFADGIAEGHHHHGGGDFGGGGHHG